MSCLSFIPTSRLLFILVNFVLILPATTQDTTQDPVWDHLRLVQQWGPAFCASQREACNVPSTIKRFTLHGLRPYRNDNSFPSFCIDDDTKIHITPTAERENNWPTFLIEDTHSAFWSREYRKHGSCIKGIDSLSTPDRYIDTTLNLIHRYNITAVLASWGIRPNEHHMYTAVQISQAIRTSYKVQPLLWCATSVKLKHDMLQQVVLCFDKKLNIISCPESYTSKDCPEEFYMHPNPNTSSPRARQTWLLAAGTLLMLTFLMGICCCLQTSLHHKGTGTKKVRHFPHV